MRHSESIKILRSKLGLTQKDFIKTMTKPFIKSTLKVTTISEISED